MFTGFSNVFTQGQVYRRPQLHELYGGQPHNRISTPAAHDLIFLFANDQVDRNDFFSGWTSYGIYRFIGEGRYGHMSFTRGNRALRYHERQGKALHIFTRLEADNGGSGVRYEGQFHYRGHFYKEGYDLNNEIRRMIVFVLKPLNT